MRLDPSQEHAVEIGCTARFGVITGGPGTGKSTTVRAVLDRLDASGEEYALAAPTGKAAKRMAEATGRDASTIHRLLEWRGGFSYRRENPLPYDVVLVDEASMLDIELASALLTACKPETRVIFVGDANQLPSVGPGRVLADLVESGTVPVARLTHVHRAAQESWVCRNAPRVLAGSPLEIETLPDFEFARIESADDVAGSVIAALERHPGAQILSPQRTTRAGVDELNARVQGALNQPNGSAEWKVGDRVYRVGDRVIQTSNNYKLTSRDGTEGVFNGEVGEVVAVGDDLTVDFADRVVDYDKAGSFALDLAYALTIHKSQGSEFDWVIVVVHSSHTYMLTRQLFYTAITRAKRGVVLVGNREGIAAATAGKKPQPRNTGLIERIANGAQKRGGL
jgi:exodeoxyribonuclease V alpha subunit